MKPTRSYPVYVSGTFYFKDPKAERLFSPYKKIILVEILALYRAIKLILSLMVMSSNSVCILHKCAI